MKLDLMFFLNSLLLGVGLAMDAFSVSVANGLGEPNMKKRKLFGIAGVFAGFQLAMPLIGWICVSTVAHHFKAFERFIPFIALTLLLFIGGKMILDALRKKGCEDEKAAVGIGALLLQGVATSIDALSVGFTIAEYNLAAALIACLLIGAVTYLICLAGLEFGKKASGFLADKAGLIGGIILIVIGLEIFIKSLL